MDKFLLKLLEKCYEQEIQDNVKTQLQALEKTSQSKYSKSFSSCDQKQRQTLFLNFSKAENKKEKDFFELIKSETIRGFSTSKEVMVNRLGYKVIPGHYYGCVNVNE